MELEPSKEAYNDVHGRDIESREIRPWPEPTQHKFCNVS